MRDVAKRIFASSRPTPDEEGLFAVLSPGQVLPEIRVQGVCRVDVYV